MEAVEERELDVISKSRRGSQEAERHTTELVQPHVSESCFLDIPADPDVGSNNSGSRRCSTRMLSMNLQHTLRQLRKEEHNARVSALLKRNAIFYKRQRFCECITMLSVLSMFTCFSLYIVFAHGFHFGKQKPFAMVHNYTRKMVKQEVRKNTTLLFYANFITYFLCNSLLEPILEIFPCRFRMMMFMSCVKQTNLGNGVVGFIWINFAILNGSPMALVFNK